MLPAAALAWMTACTTELFGVSAGTSDEPTCSGGAESCGGTTLATSGDPCWPETTGEVVAYTDSDAGGTGGDTWDAPGSDPEGFPFPICGFPEGAQCCADLNDPCCYRPDDPCCAGDVEMCDASAGPEPDSYCSQDPTHPCCVDIRHPCCLDPQHSCCQDVAFELGAAPDPCCFGREPSCCRPLDASSCCVVPLLPGTFGDDPAQRATPADMSAAPRPL